MKAMASPCRRPVTIEGDNEELRDFADPEPQNSERDPGDPGDRAQDLDDRLEQEPHDRHPAGKEANEDGEQTAGRKAGQCSTAAPVDVVQEDALREEVPRCLGDFSRRRDEPITDQPGARRTFPQGAEQGQRYKAQEETANAHESRRT